MKSAASYFSLSLPLIKENLRRYWAIPVLAFLVYFLAGIFPLLIAYNNLSYSYGFIRGLLTNYNWIFMCTHLLLPIITGVVVFRYLQTPAFTTTLHAMPFTRAKLFHSTALSGLILATIPVLLTGLILLVIAKPVYSPAYSYPDSVATGVDAFARADIWTWLGSTLLIILVLYAVTVFAGLVAGNSIMHFLASVGFNFLPAALFGMFTIYCSQYLYGFAVSDNWFAFMLKLSPFLYVFSEGARTWLPPLLYLLTALALLGFSLRLYYQRALERASDSFVFGVMTPIATFLIAFFGMSLIGFYFAAVGSGESYLYAGLVTGAVLFFLLGRMIAQKTLRVFDRETARSLGVYLLCALVFVLAFTLDFTGFEKRLPQTERINGVTLSHLQNGGVFTTSPLNLDEPPVLTTPANIQRVRTFHQNILNNRPETEATPYPRYTYNTQSKITYYLNGAFDMYRQYSISYGQLRDDPELAAIFESEEYKAQFSFSEIELWDVTSMDVFNQARKATITGRSNMLEILACLDRDFQAQRYAEAISMRNPYAYLTLSYRTPNAKTVRQITIPRSYRQTIAWLNENGYGQQIEITPEMLTSITVYKRGEANQTTGEYYSPPPASRFEYGGGYQQVGTTQTVEITDKEQIAIILDTAETNVYSREYYEISASFPPEIATEYGYRSNYYFNEETAPDFLKAMF